MDSAADSRLPLALEVLVPSAAAWIARQERWILRDGEPLVASDLAAARAVGVRQPERVRVLRVERVPSVGGPVLQRAAERLGIGAGDAAGMAMRYGVFLRRDLGDDRWVLAHELTHTAQYERLGGIAPFLRAYVHDVLAHGYHGAAMEAEANAGADRAMAF
jgi:hypothetical protein